MIDQLLAALSILGIAATTADARIWTVGRSGADYPMIAAAIAAAEDGDVIEVQGGVYREHLVIDKRLRIVGIDRPVLRGTGAGTVITIVADGSELSGFIIEDSGTGQTNAMDAGIHVASNGNRIAGNLIRRTFYGVVVTNAARNEIVDNEIHGFRDLPFGRRGDGIYLYRAPENIVAGNRITGERDAIYFQYAPRGQVTNNVASDSRYGLHDMFSDDTLIVRNEFRDAAVGANIMNSRRIRFEHNRILRNRGVPGVGLAIKDCDDSLVRDNTIAENARGLLLDGSSANQFVGNMFRWNDTALTLFSSAERNAFGDNVFDGNWSDVVISGRDAGTRWSIDGRGNRWDRYRGFDFDDDGVGDMPHPVVGAFEQIEGANPAVRMFLRSPAAAGLELAARLRGVDGPAAADDRPLAAATAPPRTNARPVQASLLLAAAALAITWRRTC